MATHLRIFSCPDPVLSLLLPCTQSNFDTTELKTFIHADSHGAFLKNRVQLPAELAGGVNGPHRNP